MEKRSELHNLIKWVEALHEAIKRAETYKEFKQEYVKRIWEMLLKEGINVNEDNEVEIQSQTKSS